jgi:undecaprenyl-diphosphatase
MLPLWLVWVSVFVVDLIQWSLGGLVTAWQAILLGILQGVTEFLPVSSSGHLVIVPHILDWPDPGLAMDAMLHVGTLVAILGFFARDLWELAEAAVASLTRRSMANPDARIAWAVVIATVPGALLGFFLEDVFERLFGMPRAAAGFLLVTAALLIVAEYAGRRDRLLTTVSWFDAILVGLAQALAIAPGISRSGATIAAGMLLGFEREDAARFSFFLAVPIMVGSGAYQAYKLATGATVNVSTTLVLLGMVAAAVSGYLAIASLMALVRRQRLTGFAVYCALLGTLVLTGVLG